MFAGAVRDLDDQRQAVQEIEAYLDGLIAERKQAPREDFIGMLLEAEVDGHRLTDHEVRGFGILMLIAGHETTSGAMGLNLLHLAQHPEQQQQLFGDLKLVPSAVNELLRFVSPVQVFGRNAAQDLDVHGQHIPAGDVVALGYGAANHDPREFPEPDRCILDRRPNKHVAFGHGHHLCLGANLARLELAIMFEQLADLMPSFALDASHPHTWKARGDVRGLASLHLLAG
jgi:cytochrome P450